MIELQIAIYARVCSEQQAEANTIASQLAALRERVLNDEVILRDDMQFIDEGYSGATLLRPALERLRDLIAAGGVDRLYIHSPDRLARKYAYQVLLIDEFRKAGVEVSFLNRKLGQTPEDDLLLQVQGMMAEYERAKIMERNRRGKLHAARNGSVNILGTAPYGYRYINKHQGNGTGYFEIILEETRVVKEIFQWVGQERISIGEVCRRLNQAGELTRSGKTWWDRTTIWGMLKNPAYKGSAAFGKTKVGPIKPRIRAQRGHSEQPKRPYSIYDVEKEQWITISVPAIVSEELFDAVAEQLQENRQHARQRKRGASYFLQGLVCCKQCGHSYYGKPVSNKSAKGQTRDYAYYRCIGTDAYRFGGQRICANKQVRTDLLEAVVWAEVKNLLEQPQRLEMEYQRRLQTPSSLLDAPATLELQINKLRQGIARLIDSYAEGFIERVEFEPRIKQMKERL
jgi:site-specific DNA recombinase